MIQASLRPDLLHLEVAVADPAIFPTRQLNRAMAVASRSQEALSNSYDFALGNELLRAQIARRAMEAGCLLSPVDFVVTIGCTEALNLCLRGPATPFCWNRRPTTTFCR